MTRRNPRRKRRRRWLIALAWAGLLVAAGASLSLYLALRPERLRGWIHEALASSIRGEIDFSPEVELDLWNRAVAVRDVVVKGPRGGDLLRARRVAVLPRLSTLITGKFEVREVALDGPQLRLVRRTDGTWNIAEALGLESLAAPAAIEAPEVWPRLRVRGGQLTVLEERKEDGGPPPAVPEVTLHDVSFDAQGQGRLLAFKGEMRHPDVRRLAVSGTLDPDAGELLCEVKANKIDLSEPRVRLLGEATVRDLGDFLIEGFVDVEGSFRLDRKSGFAVTSVSGQFIRCRLAPGPLVFPVKGLGGRFELRGNTVELRDLEGAYGEGRISGEAVLEFDPREGITGLELSARATAIPLDHRLRAGLDPPLRRVYDSLRPGGSIGLEVRVVSRPFRVALEDLEARLTFNGVDFAFRGFPYRFFGLTGEASLEKGKLSITQPLNAQNGEGVLTVTGAADLATLIEKEGAAGGIDFQARVDRLRVDEELREALPQEGREVWDDFQPTGSITLTLTLARPAAGGDMQFAAFVNSAGVRMSYATFPYEISDITGQMHFEFGKVGRVTLTDLRGHHRGQIITGLGVVEWGERIIYRIDLRSDDLRMDEDMKSALSPNARRLIDELAFEGRGRVGVVIHSTPEGGEAGVNVEVDLHEGKVAYSRFPYAVVLGGGRISAVGERAVRFSDVVTRKLRPDGTPERPQVVFNGGIGEVDGERLIDFRFDIQELDVDERLRSVLPPELLRFVMNVSLEGTFRGALSGSYAAPLEEAPADEAAPGISPPRPVRLPRLVYRAEGVSASNAAVDFGVKVRRMEAEGGFHGGTDEAGNHHFSGQVMVKSGAFNRLLLRDADITFVFGKEHPSVRAARELRPLERGEFRPGQEMVARLRPERVGDSFQMLVKQSNLYGGKVQGFLVIDVGKEHDFAGEFEASGVQVALAAPDVFGASDTGATGDARGKLDFKGTTGSVSSIRGSGEGFIERARLVELPLFVGLWGLLSGHFSGQQHFNEVAIRFGIQDGKFRSPAPEGITIKSPSLHLKGGGTMDFAGNLNLSLSPEFLRMKIPLLDPILRLLKKGLAQVWINGDIAAPKVRFVTGVGLVRVPIEPRIKSGDRPLPRELRDGATAPLPPPVQPEPPPRK